MHFTKSLSAYDQSVNTSGIYYISCECHLSKSAVWFSAVQKLSVISCNLMNSITVILITWTSYFSTPQEIKVNELFWNWLDVTFLLIYLYSSLNILLLCQTALRKVTHVTDWDAMDTFLSNAQKTAEMRSLLSTDRLARLSSINHLNAFFKTLIHRFICLQGGSVDAGVFDTHGSVSVQVISLKKWISITMLIILGWTRVIMESSVENWADKWVLGWGKMLGSVLVAGEMPSEHYPGTLEQVTETPFRWTGWMLMDGLRLMDVVTEDMMAEEKWRNKMSTRSQLTFISK